MTGNEHIENLGVDLLAPPVKVKPTDIPELGEISEAERQCRIQALQLTIAFPGSNVIEEFLTTARAIHAFIHEPMESSVPPEAVEEGPSAPSEASRASQGQDGV